MSDFAAMEELPLVLTLVAARRRPSPLFAASNVTAATRNVGSGPIDQMDLGAAAGPDAG